MNKGLALFLACALSLGFAVTVLAAEDAAQAKEETPRPAVKKELVRLKFVSGTDILALIQSLMDPRYERVSMDGSRKILTVTATAETFEKIKQVVREVDVKPADLLFTVQLVLGSETEAAGVDPIQNDPLIRELRGLLRYKSYTLLDSSFVRVVNKESAEVVMGPKAEFEFALLRPDVTGDAKAPLIRTQLRLRQKTVRLVTGKEAAASVSDLISSTLNIKSGERTVVGVSKLDGGDKGLILIISGKVVD
jgi:hypothetical protein